MTGYRAFSAPVPGGALAGGVWNPEAAVTGERGSTVVAIHGITASHRAWEVTAAALPGTRLIAPDLRGRGRSSGLPGPYGLVDHADDMVRVMDALGVDHAPIVGHSMGAFVAVRIAERHPDRVKRLVLVDGGLPVARPAGVALEELAAVILGPTLQRLRMRFASPEEYRAFWHAHPAIGPWWNDAIERYVDYDLIGEAPELRSSADEAAVSVNALELDGSAGYADALAALTLPLTFIRAPRGLLDADPLYDPSVVAEWMRRLPGMRAHETTDLNHYTIVMTDDGVRQLIPLLALST